MTHPRPARLLCALALAAALLAPPGAGAASGGPDALGMSWFDDADGCPAEPPVFGAGAVTVPNPVGAVGPVALGFAMPFAGGVVSEAFVSPTGFLAFSDQMGAGASAVTQALPDAAPPNHLVAAFWRPVQVVSITTEAAGDRFFVQWTWSGGGPLGEESVWLTLHRSGRAEVFWGTSRFSNGDATVGYEDEVGAEGSTYWRDGLSIEPSFPIPLGGRSACLVPPALLDCSDPVALPCDASADVDLPAILAAQAEVYACSPLLYPGHERAMRLDLPGPRAVTVSIDLPTADIFEVPGPPDCDEARCPRYGDSLLDYSVLFAGSHGFVVDKTTPGGGDRVVATVTCTDLPALDCDATLPGSTLGAASLEDGYSCVPIALDGPEWHALVDHPADGHLSVSLNGAPAGLWVILRDGAGTCLAAGEGGATLFDAPAASYVVTVDGEAAAAGDFEIETACLRQLDCAGAVPKDCGDLISGDTSTPHGTLVDGYSCAGGRMTGGEDLYLLRVPGELLLSIEFTMRQPGQEAWLLSSCDEGDCLFGRLEGGCAVVPAGDYLLVVDGPAGSEGPYELATECSRIASPGVDAAALSIDRSPLPDDCRELDVDGTVRITVVNRGTDPAPPTLDAVLFHDTNGSGDYEPAEDQTLAAPSFGLRGDPGEPEVLPMTARGRLPFRGAVLHVKLDPNELWPDLDRGNQLFDTGLLCTAPAAAVPPFELALEWEWTGSPVEPDFADVESLPLVVDLDGDGRPEVVFGAQECCGGPNTGTMLRALSGRDGSEIWTAADPAARFAIASSQAVGDIDGDGSPEIVGQSLDDPSRLIALDAGGALLWTSAPMPERSPFDTWSGGAVVADIDGDGLGEVIWGANVIASDGSLFWTPEAGGRFGSADGGALSVVADLDLDGVQEVIAGPTAYRWNEATGVGEIFWDTLAVPDGYAAVGELDGDAYPEVLVAEHYRLHLLDGESGALRWTVDLPSGGGAPCGGLSGLAGGPPTLDDVDGDGRTDIVVMVADWLAVLEADGSVKWMAPVNECSSGISSATVFDLDGDGSKEVLLKDQDTFRVLAGEDGVEIWAEAGTSGTAREIPVVADIDADGEAEVLVVENRLLGGSGVGLTGVRAFGSVASRWRRARPLWNQHAYHVTNVWDDLSLPLPTTVPCAPPSPLAAGTFRVQQGDPRPEPLAPNLTVTLLEVERLGEVGCDQDLAVRMRIGNGGGGPAFPGFSAAWYRGDPAAGGSLLTVAAVPPLAPGAFVDLAEVVTLPITEPLVVTLVADDDGTGLGSVVECREDDNPCTAVDGDVIGPPLRPGPADVGPSLRATGHGDPYAAAITGDFDWVLDPASPRDLGPAPEQEHYHVYRARLLGGPPAFALAPGSEPWLWVSRQDSTPRTLDADLPGVHAYLVFAADGCERESAD